jgi:hypothetical protein
VYCQHVVGGDGDGVGVGDGSGDGDDEGIIFFSFSLNIIYPVPSLDLGGDTFLNEEVCFSLKLTNITYILYKYE